MKKALIFALLSVLCLCAYAQDTAQLERSLDMYAEKTKNAKSIQLVGALAIGGGLITNALREAKYDKAMEDYMKGLRKDIPEFKRVPPAVYITGTLVFSIGFVMDISASKKIRFK